LCFVHSKGNKTVPEKVATTRTEDGQKYEGWNFNSGNYLFTTDTK